MNGLLGWHKKNQEATWTVGDRELGALLAEPQGGSRQDRPQQTVAAEPGRGAGEELWPPSLQISFRIKSIACE